MATCKDCIHHDICDAKGNLILTTNDICELEYRTDVSEWWCKHFKLTADVVPRAEVDEYLARDSAEHKEQMRLLDEIKAQIPIAFANVSRETAREIFEEIEETFIDSSALHSLGIFIAALSLALDIISTM